MRPTPGWTSVVEMPPADAPKGSELWESWRAKVEEMVKSAEGKVVPLLEGGIVKILPVDLASDPTRHRPEHELEHKHEDEHEHKHKNEDEHHRHGHGHWHHGPHDHDHGHRHHRHHSFGMRLHHALHNLSVAEAFTMALVLGAGVGSILHFFFMVLLLSMRRWRCRSDARRQARAALGRIVLVDADEKAAIPVVAGQEARDGEVLPSYEDHETARLVEKA